RRPAGRPRPPAHGVQLAGAVVAALREVPAPHHAAQGPARARARGPRPRLRAAGPGGRAHRSAAHAGRPRGAGGRLARQGEPLRGSRDQLRPEADLVTDLGADSLAVVELMMALEERLGVRIEDEEAEGLRTFGDALSLVRAKLAA